LIVGREKAFKLFIDIIYYKDGDDKAYRIILKIFSGLIGLACFLVYV